MTHRVLAIVALFVAAVAISGARVAAADPGTCTEEQIVFDPYDLVTEPDVLRDPDTRSEVEALVGDYTSRIDDTVAAEGEPVIDDFGDIETPEGKRPVELIEDAVGLGRCLTSAKTDTSTSGVRQHESRNHAVARAWR
jgi:hypothetical protein